MRRAIAVLIVVAVLVAAGYFVYRWATTPLREIVFRAGNEGFRYRATEEGKMVSLEAGSFVTANPVTAVERRTALEDFLVQNARLFGAPEEAALSFAPAAPEKEFVCNDEPCILVSLYQTYQDVPIVDSLIYGGYAMREGTAELRLVNAGLVETTSLPSPPAGSERLRSDSEALFREVLNASDIDANVVTVSEAPVISAELDVAGYLVRWAAIDKNGSATHVAAVVDAENNRVQTLYKYQIDNFDDRQETPDDS